MTLIVLAITVLAVVVLLLPGAALAKFFMHVLFGRIVWFWLVMLALVVCVLLTFGLEYFWGFGAWDSMDDIKTQQGWLDLAASFGLQIIVLSLFVPDTTIRFISPLKWAAVLILVNLILLAIMAAVAFAVFYFVDPAALGIETTHILTRYV